MDARSSRFQAAEGIGNLGLELGAPAILALSPPSLAPSCCTKPL